MSDPVKLRIFLGENSSQKLILPNGIPASVIELVQQIQEQCGVKGNFRLQIMDPDFGNEFLNLVSVSDVQDRSSLQVILNSAESVTNILLQPSNEDALACNSNESTSASSCSSFDTDTWSSSESTSSRCSGWPPLFIVPRSSFDAELQLKRGNAAFQKNGTVLNPESKLKSAILDG